MSFAPCHRPRLNSQLALSVKYLKRQRSHSFFGLGSWMRNYSPASRQSASQELRIRNSLKNLHAESVSQSVSEISALTRTSGHGYLYSASDPDQEYILYILYRIENAFFYLSDESSIPFCPTSNGNTKRSKEKFRGYRQASLKSD